jgi:enoyl-CoA hydratase/carnithine racemase
VTDPAVTLHVDERGVAELALNRPDRNSMSRELLEAFTAAIESVRMDPKVRALVVTSRGKHFCAGADIQGGALAVAAEGDGSLASTRKAIRSIYEPFLSVLDVEVPTIARIQGAAIGGGLGLALACDIRIAAVDARLQANFARLGIPSGMGIGLTLPRAVGAERAAELLFTGRPVSGKEAAEIGLVLRAVAPENLDAEARSLAESIAGGAPEAVRLMKQSLRRAVAEDVRAFADGEALGQAACARLDDAREGVMAWSEKREPRFTGR